MFICHEPLPSSRNFTRGPGDKNRVKPSSRPGGQHLTIISGRTRCGVFLKMNPGFLVTDRSVVPVGILL